MNRLFRCSLSAILTVLLGACAAPPSAPTPTSAPEATPTVAPSAPTALPLPTTEAPAPTPTDAPAPTDAPTTAPSPTPSASTDKLKVVATFSILGDFVRVIAGDAVTLKTLVGPDGDAHDFEPAPSDSAALADADVIIENGLAFEGWLDGLYAASGSKATRLVASAGTTTRELVTNGQTEIDPHIWQNPLNAIQMVTNIELGLSKADAARAEVYQKNAAAYIKRLQSLDTEIGAEVDKLNKDNRKLVTSHDALGYFADRYGFVIIGSVLQSLSTEAGEPSAQDLAALTDSIRESGTKAIFLEGMSNPDLVTRVAAEAGVAIGASLYTDALGAPGSAGQTYLEAMRHNAQAIVRALR